MSEVRLDHLSKVFPGGTTAVDDFSLTIGDGEFLVLVGPSGCGKSTVLRMIAGLEDVSAGEVFIGDERVTDWPPKQRDIAMVFQNYALYPHMTVRQNMGFALRLRHMESSQIQAEVCDTAEMLGLSAYLDRKPVALSGGQRQRVAMGRAMVRRPRVFLLDEPLSNLDAKLRVSMRAELARLHQRYRTTTVYVTHDQVEAMTLGDRIAVIDKGVLQQAGTPDDLYRRPRNRFVAGFMGSPSMNFATVEVRGGDPLTVGIGGRDFEVPDALRRWPDLARYVGSKVVMGLRPAAFSSDASRSGSELVVLPLGVESLGDEKHVLFDAPSTGTPAPPTVAAALDVPVAVDESAAALLWTAKVSQFADLAIGRPVRLSVDLTKAYFFDPETDLTIPEADLAIPEAAAEAAVPAPDPVASARS